VLYPQNGDRIVAIDSVTSLHPVYWTLVSLSWRTSVTDARMRFEFPSERVQWANSIQRSAAVVEVTRMRMLFAHKGQRQDDVTNTNVHAICRRRSMTLDLYFVRFTRHATVSLGDCRHTFHSTHCDSMDLEYHSRDGFAKAYLMMQKTRILQFC